MSWTFDNFIEAFHRFTNQCMCDSMRRPERAVCHPALKAELLRRSSGARHYSVVDHRDNKLLLFGSVELVMSALHEQSVMVFHDDKGQLGHLAFSDDEIIGYVIVEQYTPRLWSLSDDAPVDYAVTPDVPAHSEPRRISVLTASGAEKSRREEDLRRKVDSRKRTADWRF